MSDRYRYIRYSGGQEELYDSEADPFEFNNLIGNGAPSDTLTELRAALDAMLSGEETPFEP